MNTVYQRKISPVDRFFIIVSQTDPPFCNQMVLEGTGPLDAPSWQKAVSAACEANPGSRIIYTGRSFWAKWMDTGVAAPIRVIDGSGWNGYDSDSAPFLFDPLPFKSSHSCEVLLMNGDPPRVAFRSHHACMDGGGTLLWANDVFRALRGEPLVGSPSNITDRELLKRLKYTNKLDMPNEACLTPTGANEGEQTGHAWKRARFQGKFSKLLPQVALATAQEARKHGQGDVLLVVPLDLRRRVPDVQSTANLTRRVTLSVSPEATVDSLQEQLADKLANLCGDPKALMMFAYWPTRWLEKMTRSSKKQNEYRGRYNRTGVISNLGKLPIESLKGGGFEARTGFFVPPGTDTLPISITLSGCGDSVEMIVAMPKMLATSGRLDRFITNVIASLKPSQDAKKISGAT